MMSKLSDSALVLLGAAINRDDRMVEQRAKTPIVALINTCRSLVKIGLLETRALPHNAKENVGLVTMGSNDDGLRGFWVTDAGFRALNQEPPGADDAPEQPAATGKGKTAKGKLAAAPAPAAPAAGQGTRVSFRSLCQTAIDAFDSGKSIALEDAMTALRAALAVSGRQVGSESGMTKHQRALADLCLRPEGATAKDMTEATGWPTIAARAVMQKIGDKYGFILSEKPKGNGRGISFYFEATTSKAA